MQTTIDIGPQPAPRSSWQGRLRQYWRLNGLAYWLILPALLFLLAIEFVPLVTGLKESLYYHSRVQPWLTHFVGLGNFVQAFQDWDVWVSLKTSVVMVVGIVGLSYALGLLAGVLLNQKLRLSGVYRALILVPWVVPFVLTGGGPANATTPLILLAYKEAFQHFDIGYGTTLAVISLVLMLALGAVYLRLQAAQAANQ